MAHKKGGGGANGNRDSISKRLGVKLYGGQTVGTGNIIVRQKGNKFFAGIGTKQGGDYTIFAMKDGIIKFIKRQGKTLITVI